MCKVFFSPFSPPHIEDLSAQVKGIQSRGVAEGKAREREIIQRESLSASLFLKSRFNQ